MFDIGFLELLIIGVVGLLVLGPERLPKAARTTGLWIGKIKRTVAGMQREINAQLEAEELRQKLNEQQKKLDESLGKVKRDVESYAEPDTDTKRGTDTARVEAQAESSAGDRLDKALESKAREGGGNAPEADASDTASPQDKDTSTR